MHTVKLNGRNIPVGKIVCIGRNYAEHIKELGNKTPDKPVIFMKPANAILASGGTVVIPAYSNDCHHEIELAVLIGKEAKGIYCRAGLCPRRRLRRGPGPDAPGCAELAKGEGPALGNRQGLRHLLPAFGLRVERPGDRSAKPAAQTDRERRSLRQNGNTGDMMLPIAELIAAVSTYFTLEEGDILLTGTPSGVGRICSGDRLEATIEQVGTLTVTVA